MKKYYLILFLSVTILSFLWITPKFYLPSTEKEVVYEKRMERDATPVLSVETEKDFWFFIERSRSVISIIVGGINVFFLIKNNTKKKKKKRKKR